MIRLALSLTMMIIVAGLTGLAEPAHADASSKPWYVGVNLAGAEFNRSQVPGKINRDYVYPKKSDIDYFLEQGFNTFRLPFLWERLELNLGWNFERKELARIDEVVAYMTRNDAYVILDPHNYARYFGKKVGSKEAPVTAFAAFWAKIATRYKNNPGVIFGLMNEPYAIPAEEWRRAADAAITAIRATGARNLILVPGTAWSGAHSWTSGHYGGSNASAFQTLTDPAGNIAFEVHQYLDSDFSGTSKTCQHEEIGAKALVKVTQWLRNNGQTAFLGEFGAANNAVCLEALDRMLQYVRDNSDVWIGWTYWAAGAWWGDYPFSVHPSPDGDRPQMEILKKHVNLP